MAPAESWCLCSLPVPGTGCQSIDGIGAPTSSLLRPPSVKVLGCSCVIAPSRAKVSFRAKVMLALSCKPKSSGLSLSGRLLMYWR